MWLRTHGNISCKHIEPHLLDPVFCQRVHDHDSFSWLNLFLFNPVIKIGTVP